MNRDDEIFGDAIELPAPERAAFLDRACSGDAALRARVAALLAGYNAADRFLETPPVDRPISLPEEKPGDIIGRYTLIRRIGEGGCGVVYLADQREPLRRQVALKVIKLGMDTRSVIARFEAERQALALMDHPGIARVFDAGATATGRPFFVMEFVDGVPIAKFCDEHSLAMGARLELFARVCLALQHAHQKGIIHRDLKPSNILVTLQDGTPVPKVIDFGIAKATQGRLTEQTLITGLEQFIGTPAYMSPEQAELRDGDIDTRSDVYSLGVLLYELLTGRPPYDPQSLVRAGIEEIRRIIREVEPPRPSTRVSTLTDADRATVARLRRAAPMRLTSVLRGDLDWIVMRCLEKDRNRRYGSAQELADDIGRHLRLEPVVARPPEALYRLRKFVARNRFACASTAAVAAALIIGTVVSVRQALRAQRAEQAAVVSRDDAQRRQAQAESLLTFMLGDFRPALQKLGQIKLINPVDEKAMAYFASLNPRDLSDTALTQQARALTQIGATRVDEARYSDASAAFAGAYARTAALVARHPENGDMLFERAQVEYWTGFIARRRGDFLGAREWLTRYRDSAVALVSLEGKKTRAQEELSYGTHNLAVLEMDRGNLADAQRGFLAERTTLETMLAAKPVDTELRYRLADGASWLGRIAESEGRFAEALDRYQEMSTRLHELIAQEPAVARWKNRLAESEAFTAFVLAITGHRAEAAAQFASAHSTQAALAEQDPKNQQWQIAAMNFRLQQIALLIADGDAATAAPQLAAVRDRLEALVAAEPAARVFTGRLATAWMLEARLRRANNHPDAAAAAERAIALSELLIKEDRADKWVRWDASQARLMAGRIASDANQAQIARQHWDRVIALLGPLATGSNEWRVLDPLAQAYLLAGQPAMARPLIERLRQFGYHPVDPLAASTMELAR